MIFIWTNVFEDFIRNMVTESLLEEEARHKCAQ